MASYWIVVPRGNGELFELLSAAFRGRTGFRVIEDRRTADAVPPGGDRRANPAPLGPDEIVVAERAETAPAAEGHASRRAMTGSSGERRSGSRRLRSGEPHPARRDQRLVTL